MAAQPTLAHSSYLIELPNIVAVVRCAARRRGTKPSSSIESCAASRSNPLPPTKSLDNLALAVPREALRWAYCARKPTSALEAMDYRNSSPTTRRRSMVMPRAMEAWMLHPEAPSCGVLALVVRRSPSVHAEWRRCIWVAAT